MADYIKVQNYSKLGESYISRTIFEKLATEAVKNVEGVSLKYHTNKKNSKLIAELYRPIKIYFHRSGKVDVDIAISLKKGAKAEKVCMTIQEEVSNVLLAYTESVPFNINVKVAEYE